MIDLVKSKEVTAVGNFKLNFLQKMKKYFCQNFYHSILVCLHKDLSNDICQTPCGLKLHLGCNVGGSNEKILRFFSQHKKNSFMK